MELYSASAEERATVCCFLVFQDMGEWPKNTNQPVRDYRVSEHAAQSESHHPARDNSLSERKRYPGPGIFLGSEQLAMLHSNDLVEVPT